MHTSIPRYDMAWKHMAEQIQQLCKKYKLNKIEQLKYYSIKIIIPLQKFYTKILIYY